MAPQLVHQWPAPVAQVRRRKPQESETVSLAAANAHYFARLICQVWPRRHERPCNRSLLRHYVRCYRQWVESA